MDPAQLHKDAILFDGLIVEKWGQQVFEDMHRGGLTAANCTCSVWENFRGAMDNIAQFKSWFDEYDRFFKQVYTTEDIRRVKVSGKVGICLG